MARMRLPKIETARSIVAVVGRSRLEGAQVCDRYFVLAWAGPYYHASTRRNLSPTAATTGLPNSRGHHIENGFQSQ